MSQKTTDPTGILEVSESADKNLSRLAEQARQAFEQKRTKECLDLTRAILLIDPDNASAHWMRSSIQSEIQRDLEQARVFLRQVQNREIPELQSPSDPVTTSADSQPEAGDDAGESLESESAAAGEAKRRIGTGWWKYAAVLVLLGILAAGLPRLLSRLRPVQTSLPVVNAAEAPKPAATSNVPAPDPVLTPAELIPAPALSPARAPEPLLTTDRPPVSGTLDSRAVAKSPDPPIIAAPTGTLAVSSQASVDIYKGDAYIGSAPVSLELAPGTHTFEYRHGNLRRSMTHAINSNETTRAMIIFDVTVQINSKPWAEVFLDGIERKALGQTPLSSVRVPIGGVLIFENPQFPAQRYRVTGAERIQNVFP